MSNDHVWYRTLDGKYIRHGAIRKIMETIFWEGYIDDLIVSKYLTPSDPPGIIDILNQHDFKEAVVRFREIHPDAGLKEAYEAVRTIQHDIYRIRKGQKNG